MRYLSKFGTRLLFTSISCTPHSLINAGIEQPSKEAYSWASEEVDVATFAGLKPTIAAVHSLSVVRRAASPGRFGGRHVQEYRGYRLFCSS